MCWEHEFKYPGGCPDLLFIEDMLNPEQNVIGILLKYLGAKFNPEHSNDLRFDPRDAFYNMLTEWHNKGIIIPIKEVEGSGASPQ